ncbi:hypothetical protein A1E_01800 [Rickettsia canadensis str. McKiel]|uniref:Uncharacterized protein n=1 Tax=Rickettsia canadensis (strain McKiel) TaxID=293613 RepID=A8EY72_RICCK|nr:hypothetical protein [Rickettsia canadensis]ABV73305.1 hypothetical protein A1E_01800 [Rickettsia canadensis str. McKiel]
MQIAYAVIGYEVVNKTLTDKSTSDVSLLNEITSGKFSKDDTPEVSNQNGNKVRIEFNKPHFTLQLLGKETTVKIQSVCEEGVTPTRPQNT